MRPRERMARLQGALREIERWLLECGAGDMIVKSGPLSGDDGAAEMLAMAQAVLAETGAP